MTSLKNNNIELYHGPSAKVLKKEFAGESVHSIITSPPYYGQRDYHNDDQIGNEDSVESYLDNLCEIFDECYRVLRDDGTLWVNLGDKSEKGNELNIPFLFAEEMKKRGWYQRRWFPWLKCLGGTTDIYVKGAKGPAPMLLKDLAKIADNRPLIWNGKKWTRIIAVRKEYHHNVLLLTLRNGQKIYCSPNHEWPVKKNGLLASRFLEEKMVLESTTLPDEKKEFYQLDEDIGWLIGLYLAEGSKSKSTIQFAGHKKETDRYERLCKIAVAFHSSCNKYDAIEENNNRSTINIHGPAINGIIDHYISGNNAKNKRLRYRVWQRDNKFLQAILEGYLSGDGHWDEDNERWRLGFCQNRYLARDLRTICARLGFYIRIKTARTSYKDKSHPIFRGEIRFKKPDNGSCRNDFEILKISKVKGRYLYDIAVEDEPHLFCLSSGLLTHNSNAIPRGGNNRAHENLEVIFMFTKQPKNYYYDQLAAKEAAGLTTRNFRNGDAILLDPDPDFWIFNVPTRKNASEHFATFPPKLAEIMMRASTSDFGVIAETGKQIERLVEKKRYATRPGTNAKKDESGMAFRDSGRHITEVKHLGWDTIEGEEIEKPIVLDPFSGMATVGVVCINHGRAYRGIEVNADYLEESRRRLEEELKNVTKHEPDLFAS